VFALRNGAEFSSGPGRHKLFEAIVEYAVAAGCLIGTYERPRRIEIDDTDTGDAGVDGGIAPALIQRTASG
jgi:hypothetical protein